MITDVGKTLGEARSTVISPEKTARSCNSSATNAPVVLAINKVDRLREKPSLLPLMAIAKRFPFAAIVPISALKGDNCDALIQEIRVHLKEGCSSIPNVDRQTRTVFRRRIDPRSGDSTNPYELPYAIAVVIDLYREEPKIVRISATIVVEKKTTKVSSSERRDSCSRASAPRRDAKSKIDRSQSISQTLG